jgi:hypothetical protein
MKCADERVFSNHVVKRPARWRKRCIRFSFADELRNSCKEFHTLGKVLRRRGLFDPVVEFVRQPHRQVEETVDLIAIGAPYFRQRHGAETVGINLDVG